MIWKKGVPFREMPPLAMIQSITVQLHSAGVVHAAPLISRSDFAAFRRENKKTPEGVFYFYMDFDTRPTGLHIYPTPEKPIIVKVRYLPKVIEI